MRNKNILPAEFIKAQCAALLATSLDFGLTILLVEFLEVWYAAAVAIGAAGGAVLAFMLNRHWVFRAGDKMIQLQAFRYLLVSSGSWALNTGGVYLITELSGISYLVSKTIVSIFVGITYNYILARRFVFA